MKTCQYYNSDTQEECDNLVEGRSDYCARHNRELRKAFKETQKAEEKYKALIIKSLEPKKRTPIAKDPKKWKNTFLCSDGTKVTQAEINKLRSNAYAKYYNLYEISKCEGCGANPNGHAHIIPQARCKNLGKTELIWDIRNFFVSCSACNIALEVPKVKGWKNLRNIEYCLLFMKNNDAELYAKFELSAIDQTKETI